MCRNASKPLSKCFLDVVKTQFHSIPFFANILLIILMDLSFAVPPLTVHILGSNQPLSASRRYDLLCQSSGSRPPASITWWKNGHRINNAKETVSRILI